MGILGFGEKYGWLMQDDWKMLLVPFMGVKDDHFPDREDTMRVLRCPQIVANEDGKRGQGQYAMNASGTAPFKDSLNLGIGGYSVGASWNVRPTTESQVRHPVDLVAVGDIGAGRSLGEMFYTAGHFDLGSTNTWVWPNTTHNSSANMLFADGHIESARHHLDLHQPRRPRPLEQ
jgi:prepilin-type processing-associated H-X9-DG protein